MGMESKPTRDCLKAVAREGPRVAVSGGQGTIFFLPDLRHTMHSILFGTESEHVRLSWPSTLLEAGFAVAEVEISVRNFQGRIAPWVESTDFQSFAQQLRILYDSLQGTAEFSPIADQQFVLKVTATSIGHVLVTGEAWSQVTRENRLTFTMELDQSYLSNPLRELEQYMTKTRRMDSG